MFLAVLAALLQDKITHPEVFVDQLAVFALIGVPAAIPSPVDPEPKPDWVYFLPH